ncbi:Fc receptor-like protein 5 [Cyprinodon tularosa]|uniref:Fc receptor-like protein 5 n=1 Tax=Cyprinodon tularosa TaxID=77115 RepID=UPI0018E22CE8|nr:Fc receptor-like protein 5 [Cyprinodon tularosa]
MEILLLRLLFLTSLLCSPTHQARLVMDHSSTQLFEGTPVTLRCEELDTYEGWTVKRNTTKRLSTCGDGWGKWKWNTSSCAIGYIFAHDMGVYWCESREGAASSSIQLTVTGGSVILQSPVHPVMEGDDVTLICRNKTTSNLTADFFKDGSFIGQEPSGNMTFQSISRTDEGLYRCNINGQGESPSSWISVTAKPVKSPTSQAPPCASGPLQLMYTVGRHLVVFVPYFISTILMVSLYQVRAPENKVTFAVDHAPPTETEQEMDVKIEMSTKN